MYNDGSSPDQKEEYSIISEGIQLGNLYVPPFEVKKGGRVVLKWPVTADNQHFKQFEQYLLKKELNGKLKLNASILKCPSIHFFDTFLGSRKMADLLTALISRNLWDHFLEKKILKINSTEFSTDGQFFRC